MKSRTEILVPLAAIQAVPIAVIAWYRLHRYAWYRYSAIVRLMAYVKSYMGLSAVVDRTIKEGIKQLIAEYPDKFYFKSYLGSLL